MFTIASFIFQASKHVQTLSGPPAYLASWLQAMVDSIGSCLVLAPQLHHQSTPELSDLWQLCMPLVLGISEPKLVFLVY